MALTRTGARWRWPVLWAALALAYFVSGRLCVTTPPAFGNAYYFFYIPAGLSLTAALLWGSWVWPGVFLGELAMALSWGQPVGSCFFMACGNSLDAALAGWWLHDRLGGRLQFDRLDHVMRLLIAELLFLQPLSAILGAGALVLGGWLPRHLLGSVIPAWYLSNVLAQLVIAPATLAWLRWRRPAANRKEYLELAALFLLALAVGAAASLRWNVHDWTLPISLFFVVPLLAWSSVRFVPSVPLTIASVISLFAYASTFFCKDKLSAVEIGAVIFRINAFMTVCLGTALFLAAATGQQRRLEREQARLIDDLRAASNRAKRLEEAVTICAWTGRVMWQDRWVSVEMFLRERYLVNINHGISEEALDAMLKELRTGQAGDVGQKGAEMDPGTERTGGS